MKKIFIAALAVALFAAFTLPAYAFENEFGGYWRARAYTQKNFTGKKTTSDAQVDSRTRLYYTAKFSENFKFVNKFEFNNVWGDNDGGDIGADGTEDFRIKNSYVDFTTGDMNFKVGTQYSEVARGFMFADDFSGIVATYDAGTVSVPFMWMKVDEKNVDVSEDDDPADFDAERDLYAINPTFNVSDTLSVNPFVLFDKQESTDHELYYVGANVDAKIGEASVWATLTYATGDQINDAETDTLDTSAYLVAAGANVAVDEMIGVHGEAFYATGDDDATDGDNDAFIAPPGQSYVWSEIMGHGIFDNDESANSPEEAITNVIAVNAGVTVKPMEKLSVKADVWFAQLAEDNAAGDKDLGTELDLVATYNIMDNLNLDLVGAYLIAGDATGGGDEDPYEFGTRLSFSF